MSRHRQQQFPSPFELPEFDTELDIERMLWVPGRKKIFLPSAPKPAIDWGGPAWDLIKPISIAEFAAQYLSRPSSNVRISGISCDDCIPSRGIYTCDMRGRCTEPEEHERQQQVRTYNDIRRSEVPMFRSRPRYGVLYDRHDRRLID